ncbi:hypothetical protein [Methylobacterium marchantiae]|uniref:Uncharacterized protein n=1 Tax=Methylobacterium marchantiae TaxID=600331 RepID=A0ABW3X1I8_9HYPH|nr:hypothetical protein AIGOOFII_3476 [Methylobacterium marchantiae]
MMTLLRLAYLFAWLRPWVSAKLTPYPLALPMVDQVKAAFPDPKAGIPVLLAVPPGASRSPNEGVRLHGVLVNDRLASG